MAAGIWIGLFGHCDAEGVGGSPAGRLWASGAGSAGQRVGSVESSGAEMDRVGPAVVVAAAVAGSVRAAWLETQPVGVRT
jgi:hypothetical protein